MLHICIDYGHGCVGEKSKISIINYKDRLFRDYIGDDNPDCWFKHNINIHIKESTSQNA